MMVDTNREAIGRVVFPVHEAIERLLWCLEYEMSQVFGTNYKAELQDLREAIEAERLYFASAKLDAP